MLRWLPSPIVGVLTIVFYLLNILFAMATVFSLLLLKIAPIKPWRNFINKLIAALPSFWIKSNDLIKQLTSRTHFELHLPDTLSTKKFYAVTANHQSWADILILFSVFNGRIPMLKFFWKKQLWWQAPIIGLMCWIYDFPVMHRHTKEQLKKHPEWKRKDFEATRKACERFKHQPGSLMIFAEGTRFTKEKHDRQHSPYQHLLKPKAGGIAFGLQCMEGYIETLLDATIIYPPHEKSFWQFCSGKTKKIIVHVKEIFIPTELRGNYENDPVFRARFQQFINQLWAEKDALLNQH